MRQVFLGLCVLTIKMTIGNAAPTPAPFVPGNMPNMPNMPHMPNMPQGAGGGPGQQSKVNPKDNLAMDKIHFIMYAGRIVSILNTDPKYEEMKEKLKTTAPGDRSLLNMMAVMSEKTLTKLDQVKSEEANRLAKRKPPAGQAGKEPPRPDYIDLDNPKKFSAIDLHMVLAKVASMRGILESFVNKGVPNG